MSELFKELSHEHMTFIQRQHVFFVGGQSGPEVKMLEPTPAAGLPKEIVYLIIGSLQFSEASLRTYAHPDLLAVAEAVNGEDFIPFSDALFIKEPGKGASVAWHQDGTTHWESPTWDQGTHGFNFTAHLRIAARTVSI
jgi:hypothetical protein